MADQTIIQVRVDHELKEQAAEVFDILGSIFLLQCGCSSKLQ